MTPLVAVAAMRSPRAEGLRRHAVVAAEKVLEAVRRAGGEPVLLPPAPGAWSAQRLAATFAALVVPGGGDLEPSTYGAEPSPLTQPGDAVNDAADLALLRAAVTARIPTLAICRGMQALNVICGGTLIQDLPRTEVPHRQGFHRVRLESDSLVARAMGTTELDVSSYHHQAVDRVGDGLRVTGRAADGCVEALEHPDAPILAVQWHPEDDADVQPAEQALFDALLRPPAAGPPTESASDR